MLVLAVTSLLLAAKLDDPIAPNFERMIKLLTKEEKTVITKE